MGTLGQLINPAIPATAARGYVQALDQLGVPELAQTAGGRLSRPLPSHVLAQDPTHLATLKAKAAAETEEAQAHAGTARLEETLAGLKAFEAQWNVIGHVLNGVRTPEQYAAVRDMISAVDPQILSMMGLPEQYDPATIHRAAQQTLPVLEYFKTMRDGVEAILGDNPLYGWAMLATATPAEAGEEARVQQWDTAVEVARNLGLHRLVPDFVQRFGTYSPENVALAQGMVTVGQHALEPPATPAKPEKPPTAGSFEDYVTRMAREKGVPPEQLTTADIELARKKYQQADDKAPRITVNAGEGFGPPQVKFGTGEEALEGLDEKEQRIVKLMASYKYIKPTGFSLRVKYWRDLVERAAAYDPTFDFAQYDSRQRLRTDFAVGKAAQNVRSLNTAIGHLGTLRDKARALQNSPLELWNKIKNTALSQVGDPRVVDFNVAANAVAGELATLFKNTSGTDQEIRAWREQVASSQSPAQLSAAINTSVELLVSRLNVLKEQYEKGMGRPVDIELLHPKSRQTLSRMGWNVSALEPESATTAAPKKKFTIIEVQ